MTAKQARELTDRSKQDLVKDFVSKNAELIAKIDGRIVKEATNGHGSCGVDLLTLDRGHQYLRLYYETLSYNVDFGFNIQGKYTYIYLNWENYEKL
jgi:hypothetical protein